MINTMKEYEEIGKKISSSKYSEKEKRGFYKQMNDFEKKNIYIFRKMADENRKEEAKAMTLINPDGTIAYQYP
jgi:hypothetical protein